LKYSVRGLAGDVRLGVGARLRSLEVGRHSGTTV
jgi:hypothetical protein